MNVLKSLFLKKIGMYTIGLFFIVCISKYFKNYIKTLQTKTLILYWLVGIWTILVQ